MRLAAIALLTSAAFGQTVGVVSAGYAPRSGVLTVAPGQVITVSVFGISARLKSPVVAGSVPLPDTLVGISATVEAGTQAPIPVPLLSVSQSPCPTAQIPCAVVTDIALQIPFEVPAPVPPGSERPTLLSNLVFAENGVAEGFVPLNIVTDRIHIANSCDTTFATSASVCQPVVTHADGSYVTQAQPAHPGEELVMYAMGLGLTNPVPKSGDKSPSPGAPTTQFYTVRFVLQSAASEWFVLDPGTGPLTGIPTSSIGLFSGLTPGFVGLYQINVQVPAYPALIAPTPCTADGTVTSDLTVIIASLASSDNAAICLAF